MCTLDKPTSQRYAGANAADASDKPGKMQSQRLAAAPTQRKGEYTMNYNYREAMIADILDAIHEEYTTEEITEKMQDKDSWFEELNDSLWVNDSVTGNASGSYTFNREQAKEYVIANMEDCIEALREFCCESEEIAKHFMHEDWEWFDVIIRCYLLGECICAALDKIETEAA